MTATMPGRIYGKGAALIPQAVVEAVELAPSWALTDSPRIISTLNAFGSLPDTFPPNMCRQDDCDFDVYGPLCPHGPDSAIATREPNADKPDLAFNVGTRDRTPAEIIRECPVNAGLAR